MGGEAARALAAEWDRILAVGLLPAAESGREPEGVPPEVEAMARERDARRQACDYRAADALRERIRASGYDVVDAAEGSAALRKIRGTRER
ncbi:MAG: hypothetical protein A2Z26_04565 [Deltaproteobacteria bacterium RBG_16_66_15]|nr:MAG: hypothetical protein A2Z26_04565 [Deltaproteobacteria bacterium RBG_16_66_15]